MPSTLKDLLSNAPKTPERVEAVDCSRFFGQQVTFKFRYPTVAMESVAANIDAPKIRRRHPEWPDQFCVLVALLAAMHVEPEPGDVPVGVLYEQIAAENDPLFRHLVLEVSARFPELRMGQAVEEQKKGFPETGEG